MLALSLFSVAGALRAKAYATDGAVLSRRSAAVEDGGGSCGDSPPFLLSGVATPTELVGRSAGVAGAYLLSSLLRSIFCAFSSRKLEACCYFFFFFASSCSCSVYRNAGVLCPSVSHFLHVHCTLFYFFVVSQLHQPFLFLCVCVVSPLVYSAFPVQGRVTLIVRLSAWSSAIAFA